MMTFKQMRLAELKNGDTPIYRYTIDLAELEKEFKAKKQVLQDRLKAAQKVCKHEKTTYNPDPSGNNDSYTECDYCGKVL